MRRMSSASIPVRRNSSTRRMGSPASWVRKEGGARRQSAASVANKLISEMINNLYKEGDMEKTSIELILSDGREGMLSVIMVLFSHALDHGDYLEKKKMDRKLFQHWAKQCKLITTDKEQSRYMTLVDWSVDSEGNLDIVRFTKVLVHIAFQKHPHLDGKHRHALQELFETHISKWVDESIRRNQNDGCQPGDDLLQSLDIDRLLCIYDAPIERIFQRYKSLDQHGNKTLSYDVLKVLDANVEVDEFIDFCKEFGLYPKLINSVQISKILQVACFGKIIVNPNTPLEMQECTYANISRRGSQSGGLGEMTYQDILLDKQTFIDVMLRVSMVVHTDMVESPTITSRVESLFRSFSPFYQKIFSRELSSDCDWVPKGVPILRNNSEHAACRPYISPGSGDIDVTIDGSNFCTKRDVLVRFSDINKIIPPFALRAHTVKPKRVALTLPSVEPSQINVVIRYDTQTHLWTVEIGMYSTFLVDVSNDRVRYSETVPGQLFTVRDTCPVWYIDDTLITKLQKLFSSLVCYKDRRNTRFLVLDKWRKFKTDYGIVEKLYMADGTQVSDEPFFQEVMQQQVLPPLSGASGSGKNDQNLGVRTESCIDFKSFLRILIRCFCTTTDETGKVSIDPMRPAEELSVLVTVAKQEGKKADIGIDDILPDIAATREQITMIEHKTCRTLDVYCGPVLSATIQCRSGFIVPVSNSNSKKTHKFLNCTIYDLNNEGALLEHIAMSDSFDYLYHRLSHNEFDFAAPMSICSRKPTGRCWQVLNPCGDKIGALWDYPGHFSNHIWQPTQLDAHNSKMTMSVYRDHEDVDYVVCFMLFTKSDCIAKMRKLLTQRGYSLRTCLYKV